MTATEPGQQPQTPEKPPSLRRAMDLIAGVKQRLDMHCYSGKPLEAAWLRELSLQLLYAQQELGRS